MKPAVMLPTYNEALNIRPLLEAILAVDPTITAVVVDDNSPDGTAALAQEVAERAGGRVRVIVRRERRGRGYAGAEGFCYCLAEGFDPILEMDADFSHDPAHIPEMLQAAREWDVVIGSRAVAGGEESGRGLSRRMITAGAAAYLRLMTGASVADPTSGYRCFRRAVMEAIQPGTLTAPGPAIVTEVLYRCRKFRIKEIPIRFRDRTRGHSKFNVKAMWASLSLAARLRLKGR